MRIHIADLPTEYPDRVIEVKVFYTKGGMNLFTYREIQLGYYLSMQPTTIEHREGYSTRSFTAFTGTNALIEPATRFNRKRLQEIAQDIRQHPLYCRLLEHVVANNPEWKLKC